MHKTLFIKSMVVTMVTTMLFSCQGKLKEYRKWELRSSAPQAVGKKINLFYTDSGKVKAHLQSPLMYDFSTQEFPYREFPEGLRVAFFDEKQQKNTVVADYGIIYQETGLVDLRGNVRITTPDSITIRAKQLYWDQNKEWVFTDVAYTIKMGNGAFNEGAGFDSNQKFNNFSSRGNVGVQVIDEKEQDTVTVN